MTEIVGGSKIEKHLCEHCAEGEGITIKANIPISQLLEDFILQTSCEEGEYESADDLSCEVCGMTFDEFHDKGQLGCQNDYKAFEPMLDILIARAHEGATQHVGKVPRRAGVDQQKQNTILRLRGELKQAIKSEQYERAAQLRDEIKRVEE